TSGTRGAGRIEACVLTSPERARKLAGMSTAPDARLTLTDFRPRSVKVPLLRIAVTLPDGSAVEAPLGLDAVTVGSGADCDIVLADHRVSRRHCRLTLTERGVLLEDLDSKNGTVLGNVAILRAIVP